LERLAGDAALVAIAGANGRGKSTILDNLHPFLTMPSRAASGTGGFSYYDQVFLAENVKDLSWEHEGHRYRSQVLIRANGRKSTEAYLHVRGEAGDWRPVALPDGTVSDGKTRTYMRCIEHLLGSADTFFTSAFSAQGKRPLSAYQNAEIKTLLADLLGQDEIRALGKQAGEVAALLRAGLAVVRNERRMLCEEADRLEAERARLAGVAGDVAVRCDARQGAQGGLDEARALLAQQRAAFEQSRSVEMRRAQLTGERRNAMADHAQAGDAMTSQRLAQRQRLERLKGRIAARREKSTARQQALAHQRLQCRETLRHERAVCHAMARRVTADRIFVARSARVRDARARNGELERHRAALVAARNRLQSLEREAGQAVLRAEELARRFSLTNEVPCAGTDLQGRCKLLDDAGQARALMPSAEAIIKNLTGETLAIKGEITVLVEQQSSLEPSARELRLAERCEQKARDRAARYASLAARVDEIEQAKARFADIERELAMLAGSGPDSPSETVEEREEMADIDAAIDLIDAQAGRQQEKYRLALARIDEALAGLPPPFDTRALHDAETAVAHAQVQAQQAERDYLQAIQKAEALAALTRQGSDLASRRAANEARIAHVENALGDWNLLVKCLGHDGLIALAIDAAGPALAGLANDLLLACHGARFTVSLLTQVETGKGEQREGFDILVHDGASGQSKRIGQMSGGEQIWVNECLLRAVALYLARHAGRQYGTLFSDEVDGALDPARKRMFMTMKREVLKLGGYAREIFISQTPELTALADAVIDLDGFVAKAPGSTH
ncbi:MAG: DNA repair protein, partial [Azoarcus sp.]|nr:DNA repair protein [Azoarcus sp.]